MNLIYFSPSQLPSKAAHSVHVMKMCEAFAKNGHQVLLINPAKKKQIISDKKLFEFYNVAPVFKIKHFWYLKIKGHKIINPLRVAVWLIFKKKDLLVCRDINVAMYATMCRIKVVYDAHKIFNKKKTYEKKLLSNFLKSQYLLKFTVVADKMKEIYEFMGAPANKTFVVRNGTSEVTNNNTIADIVNNGHYNLGFVGHLYEGKGMEVIQAIGPFLKGIVIHIVGGQENDIALWKSRISSENVIFHGFIPQSHLSEYINSFDACLLPNQQHVLGAGKNKDIGEITCPLKMFDYMAHRKVILASDLPVLREVLSDDTAIFCDPAKAETWITAIDLLRKDDHLRNTLIENSYNLFINNYTWKKRAEKMLDGVQIK